MKFAAEMPLQWMLKHHDEFNDYLYALLHLYLKDPTYAEFCRDYRTNNKSFTILDNSAYELGESLSNDLLAEVANELKPDILILPDKLNDFETTITRTTEFINTHSHNLPRHTLCMGVIQGSNFEELIECYDIMRYLGVEYIGIPFIFASAPRDSASQMLERIEFIRNHFVPHIQKLSSVREAPSVHLLGTWNIAEFGIYKQLGYDWIKTFDTSNPVMAALEGYEYQIGEFFNKPLTKLDDVFYNTYESLEQYLITARNNVRKLRKSIY